MICSFASANAQTPSKTKRSLKEVYFDSTYDRFEDRYSVRIDSRALPIGLPGLTWRLVAVCQPNQPCHLSAIHYEYFDKAATGANSRVFKRIKEGACIDYLFYASDSVIGRESSCALDGGSAQKDGMRYARYVDINAGLLEKYLRVADRIEGRIQYTTPVLEFKVEPTVIRAMKPFWTMLDQRAEHP